VARQLQIILFAYEELDLKEYIFKYGFLITKNFYFCMKRYYMLLKNAVWWERIKQNENEEWNKKIFTELRNNQWNIKEVKDGFTNTL
jgi:hypothetical protein